MDREVAMCLMLLGSSVSGYLLNPDSRLARLLGGWTAAGVWIYIFCRYYVAY